jgi:hypothetical protein
MEAQYDTLLLYLMYLTPKQVEIYYGLDAGVLANKRTKREGPPYRKVGRKILYKRTDLEAWLDRHVVRTIDEC